MDAEVLGAAESLGKMGAAVTVEAEDGDVPLPLPFLFYPPTPPFTPLKIFIDL